jgi:BirA family biotin operon repressor/biotin-[acetyl-CoA-carboxylase] ligase
MNIETIQTALKDIPLGGLRYFEQVGSTNDIALQWAEEKDIRDYSLVLANEQIMGRGRNGRKWQTPPDTALALSLILLPNSNEKKKLILFTALGALALAASLKEKFNIDAQIKWPNDVLIDGEKVAGILVEANWIGDTPKAVVLGMGINIRSEAVPPTKETLFPATSLEDALGAPMARLDVLRGLLQALVNWRPRLGGDEMVTAWDEHLAYKGQQVEIRGRDGQVTQGKVLGINKDGSLRLDTVQSIHFGDVHLRPSRV